MVCGVPDSARRIGPCRDFLGMGRSASKSRETDADYAPVTLVSQRKSAGSRLLNGLSGPKQLRNTKRAVTELLRWPTDNAAAHANVEIKNEHSDTRRSLNWHTTQKTGDFRHGSRTLALRRRSWRADSTRATPGIPKVFKLLLTILARRIEQFDSVSPTSELESVT